MEKSKSQHIHQSVSICSVDVTVEAETVANSESAENRYFIMLYT